MYSLSFLSHDRKYDSIASKKQTFVKSEAANIEIISKETITGKVRVGELLPIQPEILVTDL